MGEVGAVLGIAWRIGLDLWDATTGDELSGRPPGSELRAGRTTLPLLLALEADEELAGELETKRDSATVRRALAAIRDSGALERSADEIESRASRALELIEEMPLANPEPLQALARLCADRIPARA
jgi:heptaprenyl diphosphate synthase